MLDTISYYVEISRLKTCAFHDEYNGRKACNDAHPRAIVRNRVHRIYLPVPLHAQARSEVQTGLPSPL